MVFAIKYAFKNQKNTDYIKFYRNINNFPTKYMSNLEISRKILLKFSRFNFSNKNNENPLNNKFYNPIRENLSGQIKIDFNDPQQEQNYKIEEIKKIKETFEKKKIVNDKKSYNKSESQTHPDLVLIYSQQTGTKYYYYNFFFLSGYVIYFWANIFTQIPDPLFSTILFFGSISHILLIGLIMLSNRQIKNIYMKRNSTFLIVETFSFLRFKKKSYLMDSNKIKEVRSNQMMKRMNLYYITYKDKFGFFKIFDYFIFRPINTSHMFDNIFKKKIKK